MTQVETRTSHGLQNGSGLFMSDTKTISLLVIGSDYNTGLRDKDTVGIKAFKGFISLELDSHPSYTTLTVTLH